MAGCFRLQGNLESDLTSPAILILCQNPSSFLPFQMEMDSVHFLSLTTLAHGFFCSKLKSILYLQSCRLSPANGLLGPPNIFFFLSKQFGLVTENGHFSYGPDFRCLLNPEAQWFSLSPSLQVISLSPLNLPFSFSDSAWWPLVSSQTPSWGPCLLDSPAICIPAASGGISNGGLFEQISSWHS